MTVLVAANSNGLTHYLAGKYPGKIGWMMSIATNFFEPRYWMPYAVDNGRFSAWSNDKTWSEDEFFSFLDRCSLSKHKPIWVAVPDSIGNKESTLWLWDQYERRLRLYGWPLAFVAQDGMTPADVPKTADLVFIGGSTEWKWRNTEHFVATHPRIHVGRVNNIEKIEYCERLGVESCDGSGFFREGEGDARSLQLQEFLSGRRRHNEQYQLWKTT